MSSENLRHFIIFPEELQLAIATIARSQLLPLCKQASVHFQIVVRDHFLILAPPMSFSFLLHDSFEESEYDERGEIERTDGDKYSVWPHVFIK